MVEFYSEWQFVVGDVFFPLYLLTSFYKYKYKSEASAQNDHECSGSAPFHKYCM